MKQPLWLERLRNRAKKESQDRQKQHDILASLIGGRGKHGRQRHRPKGYWARVRALQKERNIAKRAILMRSKDGAKKARDRKRRTAGLPGKEKRA